MTNKYIILKLFSMTAPETSKRKTSEEVIQLMHEFLGSRATKVEYKKFGESEFATVEVGVDEQLKAGAPFGFLGPIRENGNLVGFFYSAEIPEQFVEHMLNHEFREMTELDPHENIPSACPENLREELKQIPIETLPEYIEYRTQQFESLQKYYANSTDEVRKEKFAGSLKVLQEAKAILETLNVIKETTRSDLTQNKTQ